MAQIDVYVTGYCPYCILAKRLLNKKKLAYREINVSGDDAARRMIRERSGQRTVPQIFIDGRSIGGFQELAELDRRGELDRIIAASDAARRAPATPGP